MMARGPVSLRIAERAATRLSRSGHSRRDFLVRAALAGSAIAVAPKRFLLQPNTAYAAITDVCGPDSDCAGGYTVFCCTMNSGLNRCPTGSFPAGWWRADGSSWCCGGPRYFVDCNSQCTRCSCEPGQSICRNDCQNCQARCNEGPGCDKRRVCLSRFRYGQCNQQVGCAGNVLCRVVTCTPPYLIPSLSCTADSVNDDSTAEHGAPCLQQGSWLPERAPVRGDGAVVLSPAVAELRGSDRADVFVHGTDGSLYWTTQQGDSWRSWTSLGTPPVLGFTGSPAAVARSGGQLDVFVRGQDGRLWQRHTSNGGQTWGGWFPPLGDGVLASDPAVVSWGGDRVDVFVVGTDGQIWQRFYDIRWNDAWLSRGKPAVGVSGRPAVSSWGPGRLDIFVRGADNRLYQSFYSNGWSAWLRPPGNEGGVLASSPATASWGTRQVAVFTRGTDGGLWWSNFHRDYWSGWSRIGAPGEGFDADPSAASRGCQQLDVVVRGPTGLALRYAYSS